MPHRTQANEGAGQKAIVATGSAEVEAANTTRWYFHIRNLNETYEISLGFGEAAVDNKGIVLSKKGVVGSSYTMNSHLAPWQGTINAISSGGTPLASFVSW